MTRSPEGGREQALPPGDGRFVLAVADAGGRRRTMCNATRHAIRIEDLDGPARTVRLGDSDRPNPPSCGQDTLARRLIKLTVLLADLAENRRGRAG